MEIIRRLWRPSKRRSMELSVMGVHHLALFLPMGCKSDPIATLEQFSQHVLPAFR